MICVKRFRLKPNADISSVPVTEHMGYVHKDFHRGFWKTLAIYDPETEPHPYFNNELIRYLNTITLNVVFPEDLSQWNDYDYILVMDEDFGQPYTPFYNQYNEKIDEREKPFLGLVIRAYNEIMESLPYLEEIKDEHV